MDWTPLLGLPPVGGAQLRLITWVQLVESAFQAAVVSEDEAILDEQDGQKKVEEAWRRQQELLLDLIRLTQTDLDKPARQKGLAASGSWGCFDEFNRLVPEVLSVCTVQFKAVCDALRQHAARFILQGDEIQLDRGVGVFITMNPGYLGRSELPEGLKALFRPITVMVPDFMLIMENMFMSEGFLDAKKLALKFSTLYALNKDGGFKRADPRLSEQAVLMRSLRDTNVAKIEGESVLWSTAIWVS
eukprot:g21113.t1